MVAPSTPAWWLTALYNEGHATPESIEKAMESFTITITNYFRKSSSAMQTDNRAHAPLFSTGTVQQSTICTRFDWEWLLLPVILTIIISILLIWMMIRGWRHPEQPVWKNSLLPLLFYGFRGSDPGSQPLETRDGLDKRAQETMAMFRADGGPGFENKGSRVSYAQRKKTGLEP